MSDLIEAHRALLSRWRQSMNLIGPGSLDGHYEDAALGLHGWELSGRWADLGTGAGFPGIVLADRFPHLEVELVDSRRKRCVFLEEVVARAGASAGHVTVRNVRVEELQEASYDGLVARAFAPPEVVLSHAHRLLKPEGRALLFWTTGQEVPTLPTGMTMGLRREYTLQGRSLCVQCVHRSTDEPRREVSFGG